MKLWLALLLGTCLRADEAADRTAIGRSIAALNEFPQHSKLFTADADGRSVLEQLWKGRRLVVRSRTGDGPAAPWSHHPTVTISHEPWGEATIDFQGMRPMADLEILNPRIESRTIRFITQDVALAEGVCTYRDSGTAAETTPVLFVMKKEGDEWKIASVRVLAGH